MKGIRYGKQSEAQRRATRKYQTGKDTVTVRMPKGWRVMVRQFAEEHGYSMARFIQEATEDKLKVLLKKDWANGKIKI